jgi:tetratricopeptide (TPR) repeat protein
MGGVNRWVPYIPVIIIIAGICAAIAIPQFSAYRMRSYNAAALADLTNACRAQEAHFVDNATYCDSIERLTGSYYGLYLSEDVTVYVESANKDHYLMVAFHEKGNKKYVIAGPDGGIRETEKTFTVADFDKAIEINPSDADAYYNRGVAYGHKGQYDEAISDYTKAIEMNSRHADAYYNRGTAYGHKGQHDKAISDFTKAIEINPRYAEAYYKRGYSYGEKGQFDQAIADYSKAIEIGPGHAEAYNNRGFTYYTKGQFDKAIADYSRALEINPRHGLAYGNRIVVYIEKEEYEKAWDDVNKAQDLGLQMHPGILKALREASGRER